MDVHTVLELFRDEVRELGGQVSDVVADDHRLFARSIHPDALPVFPDDFVKPGIALRYMDDMVEVRPYVYRVVCSNGQILAYSDRGDSVEIDSPKYETQTIRRLIHEAAMPETFRRFAELMRESREIRPDPLVFLRELGRQAGFDGSAVLDVLERLRAEGAADLYAVGNVVTSFARNTRDPVKRWDRECAGAAVFARLIQHAPAQDVDAMRSLEAEAV